MRQLNKLVQLYSVSFAPCIGVDGLFVLTSCIVASDDSSFMTVSGWAQPYFAIDTYLINKGVDFKVDGGISACYVTPLGDNILPPPQNLSTMS